jgi:hypothetical protein
MALGGYDSTYAPVVSNQTIPGLPCADDDAV